MSSPAWLLLAVSLPHLRQHSLRTALTMFGVALGVAAIVATTTVTGAVLASFRHTVETTAGNAKLQVTNGAVGVPEELVAAVEGAPAVASAAPLIAGFAPLADSPTELLAIFGIDLLADDVHTAQLPRTALQIPDDILFVSRPDSVAVARPFAGRRGYRLGSTLEVVSPRGRRTLVVRGLADPKGPAALFDGMVGIMDLPAAQRLLAKEGRVDRIDVRLRAGVPVAQARRELERLVGGRARVEETTVHGAKAAGLLFSLRVAMALAGLVAAVVAFFIIYHAVTVSVCQRRHEVALLGALGTTRASILAWLGTEAAVLGMTAGAVGVAIGLLLARLSLATFGGVVSSVWMRVATSSMPVTLSTVAGAVSLGVGATVAATLVPAWAVTSQPTARFLHLFPRGVSRHGRLRRMALFGTAGLLTSGALLYGAPVALPFVPLIAYVFGVNCLVLISFALLSPLVATGLGHLMAAVARGRRRGLGMLLAASSATRSPAAATTVVAAIVLGLGWTLADASLIASFKTSWLTWLTQNYTSDLVVSAGTTLNFLTAPAISGELAAELRRLDGVKAAQGVRVVRVEYAGRPVVLQALDPSPHGLPLVDGEWRAVAARFWQGRGALVSDNLARRTGITKGDTLHLPAPSGQVQLPVLGIFSDFQGSLDLGSITLSRPLYEQLWHDELLNTVRIWTDSPADRHAVQAEIERRYGRARGIHAVGGAAFRKAVGDLVENAFSLTYALVLIALLISFVGVVNFLLTAVLDRRPQIRTLHGIGVSARHIAGAIVTEGTMLGAVGVALGLAAGAVVSRIIVLHSVRMVNGWSFLYRFPATTALGVSLAALLLAAAASAIPAGLAVRHRTAPEEASE